MNPMNTGVFDNLTQMNPWLILGLVVALIVFVLFIKRFAVPIAVILALAIFLVVTGVVSMQQVTTTVDKVKGDAPAQCQNIKKKIDEAKAGLPIDQKNTPKLQNDFIGDMQKEIDNSALSPTQKKLFKQYLNNSKNQIDKIKNIDCSVVESEKKTKSAKNTAAKAAEKAKS